MVCYQLWEQYNALNYVSPFSQRKWTRWDNGTGFRLNILPNQKVEKNNLRTIHFVFLLSSHRKNAVQLHQIPIKIGRKTLLKQRAEGREIKTTTTPSTCWISIDVYKSKYYLLILENSMNEDFVFIRKLYFLVKDCINSRRMVKLSPGLWNIILIIIIWRWKKQNMQSQWRLDALNHFVCLFVGRRLCFVFILLFSCKINK